MVTLQINLNALVVILLAARIIYSETKRLTEGTGTLDFLWLMFSVVSLCVSLGGVLP